MLYELLFDFKTYDNQYTLISLLGIKEIFIFNAILPSYIKKGDEVNLIYQITNGGNYICQLYHAYSHKLYFAK